MISAASDSVLVRFPLERSCPEGPPPQSFHSHRLSDGSQIQGMKAFDLLQVEAEVIFRHPVAGRSVLDVGAWDGFFSFEAERRGASRVLATDHFCWSGPGWGSRQCFEHVHEVDGSTVEALDVDLPGLDPAQHGTFDVVLMLGVLYHLKDPLGGLERCAAMSHDQLVVETVTALDRIDQPVMRYFADTELNGDPTNFWAPNTLCLVTMLREIGFVRFEIVDHPHNVTNGDIGRVIVHAWRTGEAAPWVMPERSFADAAPVEPETVPTIRGSRLSRLFNRRPKA